MRQHREVSFPTRSATILRVDGTEEQVRYPVALFYSSIQIVLQAASGLCTVTLRDGRVMLVDDTGMLDGRPANPPATALYHAGCRPGTMHQIYGDVAIIEEDADVC